MSHIEPIEPELYEAITGMRDDYLKGVARDHGKKIADVVDVFMRFHGTAVALQNFVVEHRLKDHTATKLADLISTAVNSVVAPMFSAMDVDKADQDKAYEISTHLIEQILKMSALVVPATSRTTH